jgi:hypothetical protein
MTEIPLFKLFRRRDIRCFGLNIETTNYPVPLSLDNKEFRHAITIRAGLSNSGTIFIGSGISQLYPLRSGESLTLYSVDLNEIYFRGDTVGDSLFVIAGGE